MLISRTSGSATVSETLRQLAAALREKAASYEAEKTAQCAKTLAGAKALHLLRGKVYSDVR
jgi:hypothetical protein